MEQGKTTDKGKIVRIKTTTTKGIPAAPGTIFNPKKKEKVSVPSK